MLKRNFVLFILLLLMSAVYVNYKPENIVEDVSININNGINLSLINQNNEVFVQNIQTILAKCNMTNEFDFHLITIFNDSKTFAENTGCVCFDHFSRNFALGQLNCRVVETMLILRTSLIKISRSLDPYTILRLNIIIIYFTMY